MLLKRGDSEFWLTLNKKQTAGKLQHREAIYPRGTHAHTNSTRLHMHNSDRNNFGNPGSGPRPALVLSLGPNLHNQTTDAHHPG